MNKVDGSEIIRGKKRLWAGNGHTHETETAHKGYTPCLAYCIGKTKNPLPTLLRGWRAAARTQKEERL